ncbi:MAG: hypothetical protein KDD64_13640 [Bdellovibrionales bacterium]|nr:hypothetical protein [Bdellovibrionales bacterium]
MAQLLLSLYLLACLRRSSADHARTTVELFGLMKKIDGLTASKREQVAKAYDAMIGQLSAQIPTTVAAYAGQAIFETESKLLTRLAELEPSLKDDTDARKKMDELITSMESLETKIVQLTAETVESVMERNRVALFRDDISDPSSEEKEYLL